MADFFTSLWEGIFTPGPTPPLLLATNVTFASLQVVLLALFIATYSIHFVALSFISAGLWWAINWFAAELERAKATEREADRIRRSRSFREGGAGGAPKRLSEELDKARDESGMDTGDDIDTDTETEVTGPVGEGPKSRKTKQKQKLAKANLEASQSSLSSAPESAIGTGVDAHLSTQELGASKRRKSLLEMSGTDSEWEKVDDER